MSSEAAHSATPAAASPIALYIHIPFCETKCNYCNFNTYAHLSHLVVPYVGALETEIALWGERLGHPKVHTVFFGGGTPSWLPVGSLARILDAGRKAFAFEPGAEITAEANPGDIVPAKLDAWRAMGINRVSMGVQSFDDRLLTLLSRRHTAAEAVAAFRALQEEGFENLNLDLIYGLPHQSLDTWQESLNTALSLSAQHLSLYALTVEEGTPLWKEVKEGRVPPTDPDAAADMYEMAEASLGAAGYEHYEISNWALPGRECLHNLVYWRNGPFLGVGPGAHSYLEGARFWNLKSPAEYIRRLNRKPGTRRGESPIEEIPVVEERQPLAGADLVAETLILQLRLGEGADADKLAKLFGREAISPHLETLRRFVGIGLLSEEGGVFRLTPRGRLLSNEVFVRLLPEAA